MSYFQNATINIFNNNKLRDPQIAAYLAAYKYYQEYDNKDRETIIVLPTGTGKTGLIGILPFKISKGKVLIITPQLTIKKGILNNLTNGPDSFYIKNNIIYGKNPLISEYRKDLPKEILDKSDIIVVNIHKLQKYLPRNLMGKVKNNYFDLIIIDEGHHSTAKTWKDTIAYFKDAKIIKLTGTPFRGDGQEIQGKEIYNYPLSVAMTNNYVKSLNNIVYVPEKLYLTLDNDKDTLYSLEEITAKKLKNEDWISRSVAYSKECSSQIVKKSLELLKEKKNGSKIPHKIIAVACSIEHANEIKKLYEENNCPATIIHSKLDEKQLAKNFSDIENNRVEVVINVAMLGEGYDHKYLSIAAIFRPFRNLSAYIQFVGRILRFIPESSDSQDNIGEIIAHQNLNLEKLWDYYKEEVQKSILSKKLNDIDYIDIEKTYKKAHRKKIKIDDIGNAFEEGEAILEKDSFLTTEIIKDVEKRKKEEEKEIKSLMKILNCTQEHAQDVYYSNKVDNINQLNRPDLIFVKNKSFFDKKIKEEIIPKLLYENNINIDEKTLENYDFIRYTRVGRWILKTAKTNGAILVMYTNIKLNKKIGKKREDWDTKDFEIAYPYLNEFTEYLEKALSQK